MTSLQKPEAVRADDSISDLEATEKTPLVAPASALMQGGGEDIGQFALLQQHFGCRFLIMLFAAQHLIKGFMKTLTDQPQQFIYASYNIPAPQMQIYTGVVGLPWAMKPLVGLVSDMFPIFGFHKQPYLAFSVLVGFGACATVGLLPQEMLGIAEVVMLFFFLQLMISMVDLLTEAKYAERMRTKPAYGPALLSYVWAGITAGGLAATFLVGPLLEVGTKLPFVVALVPISFMFVPVFQNYLDETASSPQEVSATRNLLLGQVEVCVLCLVLSAGSIMLAIVGLMFESITVNAVSALVVALVVLLTFSVALRPMIAKVNAFALVQTALNFSISGASFYFYTDGPAEYPEGPHFSIVFYTSVLGIMSATAALLGVWSYNRFMADWTYRRLLIVTNLAISCLHLADAMFFSRLNLKLGIPDHVFVIGAQVFGTALDTWQWMPNVVLLSQLCPEGMEATMYALLAGCHNLGNAIASSFGAYALLCLGCQPSGLPNESDEFENLWLASVLSMALPFITVVLIPWLIPDAKQTERLYADGDSSAVEGSLLKRWRQGAL